MPGRRGSAVVFKHLSILNTAEALPSWMGWPGYAAAPTGKAAVSHKAEQVAERGAKKTGQLYIPSEPADCKQRRVSTRLQAASWMGTSAGGGGDTYTGASS